MDILTKCVAQSNEVAWRMVDGEALIISEDGKEVHMFNEVASLIWHCADGSIPVTDIVARITNEFDVDEETAQNDCLELIQDLMDKNIISLTEKAS